MVVCALTPIRGLPLRLRSGKGRVLMSFFVLSNPDRLPPGLERPVVALGNFDGLHLGHQAVFAAALQLARAMHRPAAMLTFEPHPRRFFAPSKALAQLTPASVKAQLSADFGLSGMIALEFDAALAQLSAEAFIDDILVKRLAIAGLAVGHDFRFGQSRAGNTATLAEAGKSRGFEVQIVDAVAQAGGIVS
jgi:riboflavin kinase / FMN adenylyltransferase